jgi:Bacterial cell division membrane protein
MNKVFAAIARYIRQTDRVLIFFSACAAVYGVVMVYSATLYLASANSSGFSRTFITQIVLTAVGFVAMIVVSKIDYHAIAKYWKFIAAVCVLLFIATLLFGQGRAGSSDKSWLRFHGFGIQPAEFIKVAFVVTFAKHFDMVKEDISNPKNVFLLGVHAAVPIGFIVLEKDMGMALVFIVIFLGMLFATDLKLRYFAGGGIACLIAAPLVWSKVFGAGSTQQNRILALFDPTNAKYAKDMFQQNQGISALASGELWGYGLFNGPKTQSLTSAALPERQNDMLFAVTGEELGFVGCCAIVLILTILLIRCIVDSAHSKDALGSMICIGVFSLFAVQIIINIGMDLRILPVIGIALPLFYSGGSSAVSSLLALGLVLSVYMHRKDLMFAGQNE